MRRRSDSSSPTASSTSYRRTIFRWMPLVAAIIVGVAAAAVVISLGRVADDNRRAQLSLAVFMERVHETSAIEWQAAAHRSVSPAERREIRTLHRQMKASLAQALQLDPRQSELRRLPALHQTYMTAVKEEFRLLTAGKIAQARAVDKRVIGPSFETLERAVHQADQVNNTLAEERIRTSQTAAVLTLMAGLAIIGALLWRFDQAEHAARMSEFEKGLLRESEERFRSLVQNSSDVVMIADPDGTLRYVSPSASRVVGRQPEVLVGTPIFNHVHQDDVPNVEDFLTACADDSPAQPTVQFRFPHGDGRWTYIEAIGNNRVRDPSVAGIVINCRDTSYRRELEEKLRSLSLRDDLTGLHNRRGFFTLAQQQMKVTARSGGELFLVFADLDGLKSINDTMGHGAGDQALRETADVLRQTFRQSDIISRMGGDEFAVLGEQRAKLPVELLLTRLQENLDQRNARDDARYQLELSVGVVSVKSTADTNIDDVLTTADQRMYAQKRGKRKSA